MLMNGVARHDAHVVRHDVPHAELDRFVDAQLEGVRVLEAIVERIGQILERYVNCDHHDTRNRMQ